MKSVIDHFSSTAITVLLLLSGVVSILAYDYIIEVNQSLPQFMMFDLLFSRSTDKAQEIVGVWNSSPVSSGKAHMVIGVNYLLCLTYSIFFFLACQILAEQNKSYPIILRIGKIVAWIVPLAGIADAYENVPLTMLLHGSDNALLPTLTYITGTTKYTILVIAVFYCIISLLIMMYEKIRWRRHPAPQRTISHKPDKYSSN